MFFPKGDPELYMTLNCRVYCITKNNRKRRVCVYYINHISHKTTLLIIKHMAFNNYIILVY